jgi:hypothetical protein
MDGASLGVSKVRLERQNIRKLSVRITITLAEE